MPISTGLNSTKIRVGVILAEDRQTSVTLGWTPEQLQGSSIAMPPGSSSAQICAKGDGLSVVYETGDLLVETLVLRSDDDVGRLKANGGITVAPVRIGRGFHWQKNIHVTLPGELRISSQDGFLRLINVVDVESYVACVATSEMGALAPEALLAAQTIVARCWAMALAEKKHEDAGFDVCNDDCCQRYQGTTYLSAHSLQAARETAGQVLVYDHQVIDARYSKNCGGLVEDYSVVWGGQPVPYLVPLWDAPGDCGPARYGDFDHYFRFGDAFCAPGRFRGVDLQSMLGKVDTSGSYYRWHHELHVETLLNNLRHLHGCSWSRVDDIDVKRRGASARISELELEGRDENGRDAQLVVRGEYAIRQTFSDSFLYSSAFEVLDAQSWKDADILRLRGCGWGHGVGMCQMGALGMALAGLPVSEIVEHYYPGTDLQSIE